MIEQALKEPQEWIIADQVYMELYRLLRNPCVLEKPLSAQEAHEYIDFIRNRSGLLHCGYESEFFPIMQKFFTDSSFPPTRTFDLQLAVTLKQNGVKTFYTRNCKDFEVFNWFIVKDPIQR